ncbi:MAG: HD domain-containing protein, partial [Candidatus Liptonbacteria bacterium]|nr:HD domain-containing protein [Candidatus Liptonbacteria bacterium]
FTVNAMAMKADSLKIIDPHGGKKDLEDGILRTVRDPNKRFEEDALRIMRAARFATELDFKIEEGTRRAITEKAGLLEAIAKERIRDEFVKIIMCERAASGIVLLEEMGILRYVAPELREGLGVGQNKHHIYGVFEHNVRALEYTAKKNYSLEVRLASLLHDVGKPRVKRGDGPDSTFYNHDIVGGKMTLGILDRLKFSKEITGHAAHLVRYHLFYYNVGEVSEAGVRRFLNRVGPEYVDDLMKVREADRIGSGVPKAVPYKLRHLMFMIDKVRRDPLSAKMLAVDGLAVMKIANLEPSPKVGYILAALLEEILEDPKKNEKTFLEERIKELAGFSDKKLKELSASSKKKTEEFEGGIEEEMKRKHYVK